jgi:hypothetical protein
MSRLLLFAVFFAVAFDFATPDAVLLVPHARILQSDDEEESVPSRRQRVGENEQRVVVFKGAPGSAEAAEPQPSTARRTHADHINGQKIWRVPIREALTSSVRSAAPPDAH